MDGEDILASSAFIPLPFRALGLVGLGLLCWATNLHILHLLGIDTASVLETRPEKLPLLVPSSPHPDSSHDSLSSSHRAAGPLYPAIYRLLCFYAAWVAATYIIFKMAINGDMKMMDRSRSIVTIASVGVLVGLFCPFNVIQKRERDIFLVALRRCLFPSSSKPVYFCDVILADIFTSFAKVLGDIWVSINMLMPGGSLLMAAVDLHGWSEWMVPVLISLPFVIRFRQCIAEYSGSGYTNTRPLFNAIKYASSFPVIFLSAMQKIVVADIKATKGAEEALHTTWHGEHRIFRLWLLFLVISSVYSFWWDVTNDWGLDLLRRKSDPPVALPSTNVTLNAPHRPQHPSPSHFHLQPNHPYGLRTPLLFGYPILYYAAIILNLVLRFTWSMKLSPHLHTFAELEAGVFMVEACELLRRWLWVFFRVEWEATKKGMVVQVGLGVEMVGGQREPLMIREESLLR
ncbi:hypothetical protein FRB93_001172 [Tulasnella sp. JGI-2019a]|nr:hypothetical protein FRB93_001172 [Tulasnella sp. JGI-2019a]